MNDFRIEDVIVGESPAIRSVRERVRQLAPTRLPVLIQGSTGVGKELVAQALHHLSNRLGALVSVNVCAIAETMFEDTLFGHVKGAFSGAASHTAGLLAEAHRGTLFLDEIGGLDRSIQSKLLRVIELGRYRQIGARTESQSDFRVVAAANEDLSALAATGHFRFDLLQRLSAAVLRVPSLDERTEDIPLLVDLFAERLGKTCGERPHFADDALRYLQQRRWPGNVRELKNVVECAATLANDGAVYRDDLESLGSLNGGTVVAPSGSALDRQQVIELLDAYDWDIQRAADRLGIHRVTLWRWMRRLDIRGSRSSPILRRTAENAQASSI